MPALTNLPDLRIKTSSYPGQLGASKIWVSTGGHGGYPPESPLVCPDFLHRPSKAVQRWET